MVKGIPAFSKKSIPIRCVIEHLHFAININCYSFDNIIVFNRYSKRCRKESRTPDNQKRQTRKPKQPTTETTETPHQTRANAHTRTHMFNKIGFLLHTHTQQHQHQHTPHQTPTTHHKKKTII